MNNESLIPLTLTLLFFLELVYFRLADRFNIIDKPNHRSSHHKITIRGGGIIFFFAALLWFIYSGYESLYFIIALSLISAISFLDDLLTLKSGLRSLVHLIAVVLLLIQLNINMLWLWPFLLVLIIGTINAYNFMDGTNGITGAYSLVALGTLYSVNRSIIEFSSESLLVVSILSILVFLFFNFRKVARCFAGDVGSVSIAFIIIFLLGQLVSKTSNFMYLGFLLIYGLDTVTTIIFRLYRGENIFEAHRSHFYQHLANERKWPHLKVALLYAAVQGILNLTIISFCTNVSTEESFLMLFLIALISASSFILLRFYVEGKNKLLRRTPPVN
jgi:UDP-N-acetylmuramyl pentapeptide phosphotransferase/UDP-N-acetylglucosamine-1-phosphate transferase